MGKERGSMCLTCLMESRTIQRGNAWLRKCTGGVEPVRLTAPFVARRWVVDGCVLWVWVVACSRTHENCVVTGDCNHDPKCRNSVSSSECCMQDNEPFQSRGLGAHRYARNGIALNLL
jgi:hypothetical protein